MKVVAVRNCASLRGSRGTFLPVFPIRCERRWGSKYRASRCWPLTSVIVLQIEGLPCRAWRACSVSPPRGTIGSFVEVAPKSPTMAPNRHVLHVVAGLVDGSVVRVASE